jgi:hypothetical protein
LVYGSRLLFVRLKIEMHERCSIKENDAKITYWNVSIICLFIQYALDRSYKARGLSKINRNLIDSKLYVFSLEMR